MGFLRTILALIVCLIHAGGIEGYVPMYGDVAVQGFYVVSGFYIAMVFTEKYARLRHGIAVFWINRYLRLAPAYAVVSLIVYLTIGRFALGGLDVGDRALILLSQFTMIGQDVFMFLGYEPGSGRWFLTSDFHALTPAQIPAYRMMMIPQGWSIGVELWFYALAPFLVLRRTGTLVAIIAAALLLRLASGSALGLNGDPWNYRFFPFELGTFLLGVLSYRAWRKRPEAGSSAVGLSALAGLLFLIVFYHYLPFDASDKRWLFLLLMAFSLPRIFEATRHSALDRRIGGLSYPLYIVHLLCFALLAPLLAGPWRTPLLIASALACAALLAFAIERPGERLRYALTKSWGRLKGQAWGSAVA
ncbi:MAG: acyltransferase family protein [Alphaproteobacteria bacterium]